jgi:hypothetical protein
MAKIKGFGLRGLLKFAKEKGVAPGDIVRKLPEAIRPIFAEPIMHGDFYPYEAFGALLEVVDAELGKGDGAFVREFGQFAARQDVGGIFRIVSFITSPETAVKRAGVFWSRYCDTGKLVTEEARAGAFRVAMENFPGIHPLHCRLLEGWIVGLGEVWGVKEIRSEQIECVHRGGTRCVFAGGWRS